MHTTSPASSLDFPSAVLTVILILLGPRHTSMYENRLHQPQNPARAYGQGLMHASIHVMSCMVGCSMTAHKRRCAISYTVCTCSQPRRPSAVRDWEPGQSASRQWRRTSRLRGVWGESSNPGPLWGACRGCRLRSPSAEPRCGLWRLTAASVVSQTQPDPEYSF